MGLASGKEAVLHGPESSFPSVTGATLPVGREGPVHPPCWVPSGCIVGRTAVASSCFLLCVAGLERQGKARFISNSTGTSKI